jgi:hypothetical protein
MLIESPYFSMSWTQRKVTERMLGTIWVIEGEKEGMRLGWR